MKIAKVIVDVPLMQTDKPFSYSLSAEFENLLEVGMRVHVPFGSGNRLVQGIVIGFEDEELEPSVNLKGISELLDVEPVLTDEQLWLADEMRHSVFSYKISCLKAMLPNLLNSNYDKLLKSTDGTSVKWSQLTEAEKISSAKAVRLGQLSVEYLAKSKENKKTEKFLSIPDIEKLAEFEIEKRAKKRLELKYFLLRLQEEKIAVRSLNFSSQIIKFFVEHDLVKIEEVEISRTKEKFEDVENDSAKILNSEQNAAYEKIIASSDKPFLLEGITGSGKTEVYLQTIDHFLKLGKTAIMLVPEISLTPQITNRFIARFGDKVAIMHSGLSDGEKYDEWRKIKSGKAQVVVGARSAIFAPVENLGIIIIDEEHETSYKQDSSPRYHARDIALLRAKWHGARLVLGSATPSLETRARAMRGVYELLLLTKRANEAAILPEIKIIDMRSEISDQSANFSQSLLTKIKEKIDKDEQVILMLNRRGYSSFVMCRECGFVVG